MTTEEGFRLKSQPRHAAAPARFRAQSLGVEEVPYGLTEQELNVLYHLKEGLHEEQIALILGVPRLTVQGDVASVMAKMNARSRTEAAVRAIKEGIFRRE